MTKNKISSTVRMEFDAGHRIIGHQNKCRYLHGHRYILEVSVCSENLNDIGMVVDFGVIKSVLKNWIDENFDHTLILNKDDEELGCFVENYTKQKVYYLPFNPTSENIVLYLSENIIPTLFKDVAGDFKINSIKLNETPNCYSIITC
jgi:6-pyruvoyltetrahydropterin/6-carboxytetrahydropterin synthase